MGIVVSGKEMGSMGIDNDPLIVYVYIEQIVATSNYHQNKSMTAADRGLMVRP